MYTSGYRKAILSLQVVARSPSRSLWRSISTQVRSISATPEEVRNGRLSERNLEQAVRSVLEDGLVVVENVVEHHHLDRLNQKMVQDSAYLSSLGDKSPFNYNKGNMQQDAPPLKKYFEPSIFFNPIATQISSTVLGPKPKLTFMSGNTAMPPTPGVPPQRQPVHSDADFNHPSHPFALVVNIPLVTMRPENGSTEVWLGTHKNFDLSAQEGAHGDRASGRIQKQLLDQRRISHPPLQPVVPKGSIIVRDLRLWHAGMPNHSQDVRVMLAMIHFAPWYRNQMRIELGDGIRYCVEELDELDIRADFVPERQLATTYLHRGFGNSYDFNQVP